MYGLAYEGKDEGLRHILDGIAQINREAGTKYKTYWDVINCAEYGVPQIRERVFMVGSREGRPFRFPEPSHAAHDATSGELFESRREAYLTAWDAIGDLAEPKDHAGLDVGGRWGDLLPTIPEGQNYLWHTSRSLAGALDIGAFCLSYRSVSHPGPFKRSPALR